MIWTQKHIDDLIKSGKIKGYVDKGPTKKSPIPQKKHGEAQKAWMKSCLMDWCYKHHIMLHTEYQFHAVRKWRFDFAIINGHKIAIEYEGLAFAGGKSRHTTKTGYINDAEKYNAAAKAGWTLLRYTAKTYKNLEKDLHEL